ncbi:nucleolar complex protein 14 [Coemansia brasiliensis]|uniref:Nucleolar complex protein 14 n=1 Tax=Coemansia brasiliensis TaxID=2650707 RepID=A0A9W8I8P8_9FUNG|nr:nucleolar complex protein 14 [Coemansia brasiliensis]
MAKLNAAKRNANNGKQSALKKLRTALSSSGITGAKSHVSKRDRKRGIHKTTQKADERRQKLQAIQSALNPFEFQTNRKKLDVLGLKRKDDVVNVAVARQRAVEKRKNTLGKERQQRNRFGGVVDQRIGENDPTMDPEERMLKRFTMERQKRQSRGDMFNLEDDVEGEITSLTHFGRSIDEIDEFDEPAGSDYGEDDKASGAIGSSAVSATHFGGFEPAAGEEGRKKTKNEIMQEIIAKSKQHKYERQMLKEQDDGVRRELDDDFESVRALLFADKDQDDDDMDVDGQPSKEKLYDSYVRDLVFEKRGRPQDRLKTEEEQAREELERLERAERHRLRRMEGLPSDSEPDSDSDTEMKGYDSKKKRRPEADDLGDDFEPNAESEDEINVPTEGVDLGAGLEAGESSEEEDSDSEEEEEEDDDDEDDGSDLSGSDSDAEANEQQSDAAARSAKPVSNHESTTELPFTFVAPTDYDTWVELVAPYTLEQQLVIIKRMRTQYHIRLAPQNKGKLAALAVILTNHLAVLTEQNPPVPKQIIDDIVRHIGELASVDPEQYGEYCRELVIGMQRRIQKGIRQQSNQLRASDVALARLFVSVFSSSDRYHAIITPMMVAIAQFLSQHTFTSIRDVSIGLALAAIVHEAQRLSRRLVPEVLNYVTSILAATVCDHNDASDWSDGCVFPLSRRQREALGMLHINAAEKCTDASDISWAWLVEDVPATADSRYAVLRACLALCRRYVDCYFSLPAFIECFQPLAVLLDKASLRLPRFKLQRAPDAVLKLLEDLQSYLADQLTSARESRHPLKLQYHKPLAIASVAPKFESSYNPETHYDPDRDRSEIMKLRRQVARERRGTVRELRRDAQFLAGERLKEQKEKDKAYADKMKKAWSVLESDQSEMKKLDKQRIKERKAKV